MAIVTIERPGVQVIQEFQTVSPTVLIPSLPAAVLGPCNQIIEAVQDDGSLNPDAQIALPARLTASFVSTPFEYTNIGGDGLSLSVNNAAAQAVTFPGSGAVTVDEAVDAINGAEISGILAVAEESGSQKRLVIYTTAVGDNASLQVHSATAADVLTAFGFTSGYKNAGSSGYTNYVQLRLQTTDYPDPRDIIDEVAIDYDTIRVFINDGTGSVREVLRTETFLQGDTSAVAVTDDGDGDNLSPYLSFSGAVFKNQSAVLTGTVDWSGLSYPAAFGTSTLEVIVDGTPITVTFANPADETDAITQLDTELGVAATATLNGSNQPVITSATSGVSSSIEIGSAGSINEATIGLAVGRYAAGQPSKARAQGTADLSAIVYSASVHDRVLRMSIDGDQFQTLTFSDSVADENDLIGEINDLWGTGVATINNSAQAQLVLNSLSTYGGRESSIRIDKTASDAALLTALGLTGGGSPFETTDVAYGNPYAPAVGDEVWVDGIRVGQIVEVPTSPTNRLRMDSEQLLSYTGSTWYIRAKNLDNEHATASRPSSDLVVDDTSGTIRVKHEFFRETDGDAPKAGPLSTYVAYNALRKDVSPVGEDFNLLRYGSTAELEAALSPLDTQNPLGLGMYFAILNAPGVEVTGLGVDDTSSTEPEGTLLAYTKAFEFLESKDVYAIAPLTHSGDVGLIGQIHVNEMSDPENGLERCVFLNPRRPTRKSPTLVASGATANVSGAPTDIINTGVPTLQALLAAAGKPGPSYTEDDGVYIELEDDTNKYLVASVSGGDVTINNGPLSASNSFFFDNNNVAVFSAAVVDRPFSLFVRGAALSNLTDEAVAYSDLARGYKDRRVIVTAPDTAKANIDGLETQVAGYYMNCALVGKTSAADPQQPFTEESIAGFSGVIGAQDRYSEYQLKILSGGGLWVLYQEADGQPVKTRHQLTSDMSSVQKREYSILKAVDFSAKFLRAGVRNFIGRFNLTTNVQDAISITLEGLGAFLVRAGVLTKFEVIALRQSATAPDTLEVDVEIGVPAPLNYLRITLKI